MVDVRCPNCGTSFVVGEGNNCVKHIQDGVSYLVPSEIRNENIGDNKLNTRVMERLNALKEAGINIDNLRTLMSNNNDIRNIFEDENDPILEEIKGSGFIRNPELFRRWITAQTFKLLKDRYGWTHAVRATYDIKYVLKQLKDELYVLDKLARKGDPDKRFEFFRMDNLKVIICELVNLNTYITSPTQRTRIKEQVNECCSYSGVLDILRTYTWRFKKGTSLPTEWLNCFKGAGAYYTLQNIIRTHGFIVTGCSTMQESLDKVESIFKNICQYNPTQRRWDMLMSVLVKSVKESNFELKW